MNNNRRLGLSFVPVYSCNDFKTRIELFQFFRNLRLKRFFIYKWDELYKSDAFRVKSYSIIAHFLMIQHLHIEMTSRVFCLWALKISGSIKVLLIIWLLNIYAFLYYMAHCVPKQKQTKSIFVDSVIKNLMKTLPSYIQDTTDILQKCSEINVDENDLLVTTDVNSLKKNSKQVVRSSSFKQSSRLPAPA